MTESFYVIARQTKDRSWKGGGGSVICCPGEDVANGYMEGKCEHNMKKRLMSAALTQPGETFVLLKSVAECTVPQVPQVIVHKG